MGKAERAHLPNAFKEWWARRAKPAFARPLASRLNHTAAHTNALPLRRIFPTDGEGKCAVQHSVSVSQ